MAENTQLSFDIRVGGNQDQALGSLKAQLREATAEVTKLSEQFGASSKEAVNAAKRAAELKDQIGDAKSLIDAFNPDAKFKALTASLGGVAGGFSALQGATALFGKENEDLEKTLLKVNSAMALSQGLQAVGESIDSFRQLGTVIKTQVVSAFSTLRGAIIATGIGALAIAIGLVAANFDKVKKAVLSAIPGLETFGNFIGKTINSITDFIGVTSDATRALDKLKKDGAETLRVNKKFMEEHGDQVDQYTKKKIEAKNRYAEAIKQDGANTAELGKRLNRELAAADKERADDVAKAQAEASKEAAAKRKAENDKRLADEKQLSADLLKNQQDRRKLLQQDNLISQKQLAKDKKEEDEKAKTEKEKEDNDRINAQMKVVSTTTNFALQGIQKQQEAAKASVQIDKLTSEQKIALAQQTASALTAVSDILGKETAAGKALAISAALINTYQGISAGVKLGFPAAIPAVALAAATGFSAVKNIISTKVPGAASGGGGNMTAPSLSAAAPIAPPQPQAATTNLSSQTINAIGNQAVRAYVVENDVTSNQQRIAAIQQRARFG
jgi:hypothetical protein